MDLSFLRSVYKMDCAVCIYTEISLFLPLLKLRTEMTHYNTFFYKVKAIATLTCCPQEDLIYNY